MRVSSDTDVMVTLLPFGPRSGGSKRAVVGDGQTVSVSVQMSTDGSMEARPGIGVKVM